MPDFMPAPGSTATAAPSPLIFLTVSGTAATRGSPASVSATTATFMIPPMAAAYARPATTDWIMERRLGEKNRHQDHDGDDDAHDHLHQGDEVLVGLLVGGVIVAVCGCVLDFSMVGHSHLSKPGPVCGGLSVIGGLEQRHAAVARAILRTCRKAPRGHARTRVPAIRSLPCRGPAESLLSR